MSLRRFPCRENLQLVLEILHKAQLYISYRISTYTCNTSSLFILSTSLSPSPQGLFIKLPSSYCRVGYQRRLKILHKISFAFNYFLHDRAISHRESPVELGMSTRRELP
uniref:Uncharacterized protein n=1 Tax=Cacopsylla melanoneura TaxID=428564 RepID=A0A8D8ZC20_9HEMI